MKRLPMLLAVVVGAVAGLYTLLYLARWEWNRALIAGMFFVAAEIVVATGLVVSRLRRLEDRLERVAEDVRADEAVERIGAALRRHEPAPRRHFAWLRGSTSTSINVFLPVLLGIGVVASVLSWLVEHVVRLVAAPVTTRRLALRLAPIAVPTEGLLVTPVVASAPPPRRRLLPTALVVVVLVLVAGGAVAGLDYLADRIQTRPDSLRAASETVIDIRLHGDLALRDPDRVFGHLWVACTGPGVFNHRTLPPVDLAVPVSGGGDVVRAVVPADVGDHGLDRLTGCLNDTTLDGVQASVLHTEVRAP